jgi:tetratricopeptide (TPR) repeat protein
MKVLLEILDDARQMLATLDDLNGMRPETRQEIKVILEGLCDESARLMRGSGRAEEAAPEQDRERARAWLMQRALEAIASGDYERAMEFLQEGCEAFPDDPEFPTHCGLVCWEQGMVEEAEAHYAAAMSVSFPDARDGSIGWRDQKNRAFLRAMEGRALCLYKLGEHEEALPFFDALANMNTAEYTGCRYLAGEIRHLEGDPEGAIEDYQLGPMEPATLYNLGLARFQAGYHQKAATTFIRAFVANSHVASLLLGRDTNRESALPGYLGSKGYAREFVDACGAIWNGEDGALEFIGDCFDHPQVVRYLEECREKGADVLEGSHSARGQEDWLGQLTPDSDVEIIAHAVSTRTQRDV